MGRKERYKIDPNRFRSQVAKDFFREYFGVREEVEEEPRAQRKELPAKILDNKIEDPKGRLEAIRKSKSITQSLKSPSLEDLLYFYKSKGLVGEESTAILQTLGAIHGLCFGIESLSGSGKSFTADLLMELLPEEYVYKIELTSNTALMYEADAINQKRIIYIPELQKALNNSNPINLEIIKNLTEGKGISRTVRAKGENVEFTINPGKAVIYTLALENAFKKDVELSRRVFTLTTDISEEQTRKIIEAIAKKGYQANKSSQVKIAGLKAHFRDCLALPEIQYINPFSTFVAGYMPPVLRSRSFATHYFNLVEASARFHHKERIIENNRIFVNFDDIANIHSFYFDDFLRSVFRIPVHSEEIFSLIEGSESIEEMHYALKKKKSPVTLEMLKGTLDELVEAGYLSKGNKLTYVKIAEFPSADHLDYSSCLEAGCSIMKENYPSVYERWSGGQMDGYSVMEAKEQEGLKEPNREYEEEQEINKKPEEAVV